MLNEVITLAQKTGCPRGGIRFSGDSSGEVTPVPIPNTVVKLSKADDTGISRESRSLPDLCPAKRKLCGAFFLLSGPAAQSELVAATHREIEAQNDAYLGDMPFGNLATV